MEEMTCPRCDGTMSERSQEQVRYTQCGSCQGVFLERSELGHLVEAENDWHAHRSADTSRLPRITPDMTAPPASTRARSYLDGLFTS